MKTLDPDLQTVPASPPQSLERLTQSKPQNAVGFSVNYWTKDGRKVVSKSA
jgi:hypothetical protein